MNAMRATALPFTRNKSSVPSIKIESIGPNKIIVYIKKKIEIRSVYLHSSKIVDRETIGPKSLARGTEKVSSVDRNGIAKQAHTSGHNVERGSKAFSATGDARRKEEKPPGAITQASRQPSRYSLATIKKQ